MKLAAVLLLVCLVGCTTAVEVSSQERQDAVKNMRYFRDPSTGLCFVTVAAAGYGVNRSMSISWVPCDAKVLGAIAARP